MSISIEISCDGLNCCKSKSVDTTCQSDIERFGWHIDPEYPEFQYCPDCWKKILSEKEQES